MTGSSRPFLAAIAGAALLLAPSSARAQGATSGAATADRLYEQGRVLLARGDFAAACPKLQASYDIDPTTGTLLAVALCHERAGRLATAWHVYRDVAQRARAEGDRARTGAAEARVATLGPSVPRLRVSIASALMAGSRIELTVDGRPLDAVLLETGALLDPGTHRLEARSADGRRAARDVELRPGEVAAIAIDAWDAAHSTLPLARAPLSRAERLAPSADPDAGFTTVQATGLVVGGLGAVGLAIGTIFGGVALGEASSLDDAGTCVDVDDYATCEDAWFAARDASSASTVALVAGGVLLAGGVTLFALGSSSSPDGDGAAALRVQIQGSSVVTRVRF